MKKKKKNIRKSKNYRSGYYSFHNNFLFGLNIALPSNIYFDDQLIKKKTFSWKGLCYREASSRGYLTRVPFYFLFFWCCMSFINFCCCCCLCHVFVFTALQLLFDFFFFVFIHTFVYLFIRWFIRLHTQTHTYIQLLLFLVGIKTCLFSLHTYGGHSVSVFYVVTS